MNIQQNQIASTNEFHQEVEEDEDPGILKVQSELNKTSKANSEGRIDVNNQKFPYCIVWTSIPLLSWMLPTIGHTGIGMSDGTIHDFAGPYFVSVNDFAFGKPLKYVRLDNSKISDKQWDEAILKADAQFEKTMHILCTYQNNCHSHVAQALSNMNYKCFSHWNMILIWLLTIIFSKYTRQIAYFFRYISIGAFIQTYWVSFLIFGIIYFINS